MYKMVVRLFSLLILCSILLIWLATTTAAGQETGPPHIILIILDSVGKGDLFVGDDKMGYSTPGFKKLADAGALIKNFYVQTTSSATRASIFTGKYPFKMGMQEQLVSGTTAHIPLNVPVLPELLKALANYETYLVGGWGLGGASIEYTPTARGFDAFYGFLGSDIDYINKTRGKGFDFWDEKAGQTKFTRPAWSAKGNYSTRQFKERAMDILNDYLARHETPNSQSEYPLFMTIAPQAMNGPLEGHPDYSSSRCKKASKARKVYCSMMMELDEVVSELQKKLVQQKLWDRTFVIVTSDSGSMVALRGFDDKGRPFPPGSVGSNAPFRGSKSTLFEGGIRGVALVSGGRLQPEARGRAYEGLAHAVDVPVFILSAVYENSLKHSQRAEIIRDISVMDGTPFYELLPRARSLLKLKAPRTEVPINVVSYGQDFTAIRFGRWKLIIGTALEYRTGDGWWPGSAEGPPQLPKPEKHRLFFVTKLYDLVTDPYEKNNLMNLTEVIKEGRNRIRSIVKAGDYMEPQLNVFHPYSLPFFHGGAWAPFLKPQLTASDMFANSILAFA